MYAFVLMLYLGYGSERKLVVDDLYFSQLNVCNRVAEALVERYSTHGSDCGQSGCILLANKNYGRLVARLLKNK